MATRTLAVVLPLFGLLGCRERLRAPDRKPIEQAKKMLAGVMREEGVSVSLPYRLYVPEHYDKGRRFPLVLFLHSAAARGSDNVGHLTQDLSEWTTRAQEVEAAFVLAPQCPEKWQWVHAVRGRPFKNYRQETIPENEIGRLVWKTLHSVERSYSIDPDRVYITGPSMGAVATWDFITRHPGEFAAAVTITGVNDPSRAPVIADLPIWAFHGGLDPASPPSNTRAMVEALRRLGSSVRYTEFPDLGHNAWNRAYARDDLYAWLFAQRRGRRDPLPPLRREGERN